MLDIHPASHEERTPLDDRKYQIVGLGGFMASGTIFTAIGIRTDDMLTTAGSLLWIASCIVWLIPLLRNR